MEYNFLTSLKLSLFKIKNIVIDVTLAILFLIKVTNIKMLFLKKVRGGSLGFPVYTVSGATFADMSFHLDYLLDLTGITVETCSYVENHVCLQLRILSESITCLHCGHYTDEMHQNRPILVRDLPTFGRAVYLRVPRRQFYCLN